MAFALGLSPSPLASFPFPSLSPFFFLGGMLRSRGPRRTRGAMQHRSIPSPCVSENSVRPDPVGFPAEVKKAPKQFRKMPIQAPAVVANSKSRKFDKNPDCASCTAAPTASFRAFKNKRISNFGGLQAWTFASVSEKPDQREHNTTRRGTAHTSRRPLAYSCSRPDLQSVSTHPR